MKYFRESTKYGWATTERERDNKVYNVHYAYQIIFQSLLGEKSVTGVYSDLIKRKLEITAIKGNHYADLSLAIVVDIWCFKTVAGRPQEDNKNIYKYPTWGS